MSSCKCTMAQSAVGDGCRYCQPQEYIDRLHDHMAEDEKDWQEERSKLMWALDECVSCFNYPEWSDRCEEIENKARTILAELDGENK